MTMRSSELMMYVCSGLLLAGGSMLALTASWSILRMSYYFYLSELGLQLGAGVLFVAAGLLCLPSCWIASGSRYNKSFALIGTLISLVSVSMVLLAAGLLVNVDLNKQLGTPGNSGHLNSSLHRALLYRDIDPAVRTSIDSMQLELKCCGVQNYGDWFAYSKYLPASCCGRIWNGKHHEKCVLPLYPDGCLTHATRELKAHVYSLSSLACVMIIIQSITLFVAAYALTMSSMDQCDAILKTINSKMQL